VNTYFLGSPEINKKDENLWKNNAMYAVIELLIRAFNRLVRE